MEEGEVENLRDLHYPSNSSLRKGRREKEKEIIKNKKAQCSLKLKSSPLLAFA